MQHNLSLYFQGVKVTKTKGLAGFNVACKWKRKYRGWAPEEGWFILTNLQDLGSAIAAYKKRFCIEEMFRDCKSGGYNLENTKVSEQRLNTLILLIAIAYTSAIIQGGTISANGRTRIRLSRQRASANFAASQHFFCRFTRQKLG